MGHSFEFGCHKHRAVMYSAILPVMQNAHAPLTAALEGIAMPSVNSRWCFQSYVGLIRQGCNQLHVHETGMRSFTICC